ncbi:type II secretion system protein [Thomasclavelia sp.]
MKRKRKGFTLVELIVVLVILGILAALLIPSLTGYLDKANEQKLITECRHAVLAGQTTAAQMYADQTLTIDNLSISFDKIEELAEIPGSIEEIDCNLDTGKITLLVYKATNNKYVIYENDEYRVVDELKYGNNIQGYLKTSNSLLAEALRIAGDKSQKTNVWTALRKLYDEKYSDSKPGLSTQEKEILNGVSNEIIESLTWKPTILGDPKDPENIMMIASKHNNSNLAYMIYYNGSYYYHSNGWNSKDSSFVTDQGGFDVEQLESPVTSGSGWYKVE